jgi:hypothetical protein
MEAHGELDEYGPTNESDNLEPASLPHNNIYENIKPTREIAPPELTDYLPLAVDRMGAIIASIKSRFEEYSQHNNNKSNRISNEDTISK